MLAQRHLSGEWLVCKAKRQYLLTSQVSRYCLFALQSSIPAGCLPWALAFWSSILVLEEQPQYVVETGKYHGWAMPYFPEKNDIFVDAFRSVAELEYWHSTAVDNHNLSNMNNHSRIYYVRLALCCSAKRKGSFGFARRKSGTPKPRKSGCIVAIVINYNCNSELLNRQRWREVGGIFKIIIVIYIVLKQIH